MTDPFEALGRMKAALEEGLALLDGTADDDQAVAAALGRVAEEVNAGPNPEVLREAVAAPDLDRFDDQLEELMRLNAVLARAVSMDRERLIGRLKSVRDSRRDLSYYDDARGPSGGRCDMSA